MTEFVDTRVDICLYFIAPHALLPVDIANIKRLGSMVPVVPIISKVPPSLPTLCTGAPCEGVTVSVRQLSMYGVHPARSILVLYRICNMHARAWQAHIDVYEQSERLTQRASQASAYVGISRRVDKSRGTS